MPERQTCTPRTYNQKPFQLDGRMDLDIVFGEKTMRTPVYIKMDAHDQLLLSEGVCQQLGILTYHPDVQVWRGRLKRQRPPEVNPTPEVHVPSIRVRLVQAVQVPPFPNSSSSRRARRERGTSGSREQWD